MARDTVDLQPLTRRDELVAWFEKGCKTEGPLRLGTEHEKFAFRPGTLAPVPYDGADGIGALLTALQQRTGWEPIVENGAIIGLFDEAGGGAVSLEPGGQLELSGAPLETLHQTAAELDRHLADVHAIGARLDMRFLALGMTPKWRRSEVPVMPKSRYRIMTAYMPKVGSLGLDMMYRTSTVQVNLDFTSEADMAMKMRVSLALQPLATALFANSPFTDGKLNGLRSLRSEIWRDTDPNRSGMLPFVFEEGFGFERYVDYALDVPMYFIKRGDDYLDATGTSFRDLFAGRHPLLPGQPAVLSDWVNHLSTIFPEVRLKRYLEMRGADVGSRDHIVALSAFWVGLLYDRSALSAAWDLVSGWTAAERQDLRDAVPRQGLGATIRGRSLRDLGREVLALARAGLKARARHDGTGHDETRYLDLLDARIASGRVAADDWIAAFNGPWRGSVDPVFSEAVI
ncbi:MAG TPA: glutamate--cysteine ligase [Beijerinckiaceae bacterium]|nr:glutamate--cysteine ligase [Beijerinckiaceae bacterium]